MFFVLLTLATALLQTPAGLQARPQKAPAPPELAAPVAAALGDAAVSVEIGSGVSLEFWFVKVLPLKAGSSDAPAWTAVEEGTLVGALRVSANYPDIRGRVIKPGVYTLRYGIQPSDGDHLGVSPFRDFLLVSPAALDSDTAARGHQGTIELSKRTVGGSHPAVLSIDPPVATAKDPVLGTHTTELGHTALVVEVPAARGGAPAGALRFGLVLIGRIEP
jgi:hypothetical protein